MKAIGDRVLDIGSFDSYWLSTQPGRTRVGVDLDIKPSDSCHVIRGDGLNLPFATGFFDSVFAFDVIEHVDDDRKFLAELVRVTRPGGTITLTTPSADLRIFPSPLTAWAHHRWGHDRCVGYEADQLRNLLREAGAPRVDVTRLRAWTFLTFYLPLSVVSRVSTRVARLAFRLAATVDGRWRTHGRRGYLLATAQV